MLSLLLLVAVPAQASPIKFAEIMNVMGDLENGGQFQRLTLRAHAQEPGTAGSTSTAVTAPMTSAPPVGSAGQSPAPSVGSTTEAGAPSLISGTEVAPQQPSSDVQVFEQDQVDGTICDCGEIPSVGGGFPKWPFLALIPLICVTGVCHHHHKVPPPPEVPTPTPTPPVPEPATLFLFGSGIVALSAGARRRYAKLRASKQAAATTEV